jgi:hypothetical protein
VKRCTKCGESKAFSEYYAEKRKKDGLFGACKSCLNVQRAEQRKRNPSTWRSVA